MTNVRKMIQGERITLSVRAYTHNSESERYTVVQIFTRASHSSWLHVLCTRANCDCHGIAKAAKPKRKLANSYSLHFSPLHIPQRQLQTNERDEFFLIAVLESELLYNTRTTRTCVYFFYEKERQAGCYTFRKDVAECVLCLSVFPHARFALLLLLLVLSFELYLARCSHDSLTVIRVENDNDNNVNSW